MTTHADVRRPVAAWIWGGGLLAASAVSPSLAGSPGELIAITTWAGRIFFAAAMVVLALGLRREGSIVARRTPGVIALLVLGFVPPLITLVTPSNVDMNDVPMLQTIAYIQLGVALAAALVAAVEIARARVLPDPWRWAPVVGLAILVAAYVLTQLVALSSITSGTQDLAVVFIISGWITSLLVPLALGLIAMLLGARGVPAAAAQIYSSAG